MKRNYISRMFCITIASTMLVANTPTVFASEYSEPTEQGGEMGMQSEDTGDEGWEEPAESVTVQRYALYKGEKIIIDIVDDTTVILEDGTEIPFAEFEGEVFYDEVTMTRDELRAQNAAEAAKRAEEEAAKKKAEEEAAKKAEEEAKKAAEEAAKKAEEEAKKAEEEAAKNAEEAADNGEEEQPAEEEESQSEEETPAEETKAADPVFDPGANITAGTGFYTGQLSSTYNITFSDDFAEIMQQIEDEYKASVNNNALEAEKARVISEAKANGGEVQDESAEQVDEASIEVEVDPAQVTEGIEVKNWQDVLAVYVLDQTRKGAKTFTFSKDTKADIAAVFAEMNAPVEENHAITYANTSTEDYMAAHPELNDAEKELLKKYMDQDCILLCAAATQADGFITESLEEGLSAERIGVVRAAYSLVGKIAYFWGGKYNAIGWNDSWGSQKVISAAGSDDSGQLKLYGMDCSGYVTWAFINGFQDTSVSIGNGTTSQWNASEEISEDEAKAGDIVLLNAPLADASDNHIGVVVGRSGAGDLIVAHCNATDNGVVIDAAYDAGFRYVRRPYCYNETTVSAAGKAETAEAESVTEAKEEKKAGNPKKITVAKSEITPTKSKTLARGVVVQRKKTLTNALEIAGTTSIEQTLSAEKQSTAKTLLSSLK